MKNSEQNKLDQILKDKLSEGTAQVPDFVWDRIEEELFPEKKRRVFFWWFFGGFCLLVIGILIAIALSGIQAHSQNNNTPNSKQPSNSCQDQKNEKSSLNSKKSNSKAAALVSTHNRKKQKAVFHSNTAKKQHISSTGIDLSANKRMKIKSQSSVNTRSKNYLLLNSKRKNSSSKQKVKSSSNTIVKEALEHSKKTGPILPDEKTDSDAASTENTNLGKRTSEPGNSPLKTDDPEPKNKAPQEKELSYAEILELIRRDFPEAAIEPEQDEKPDSSRISIGVFGGPSLYHSAVFKDYFTSGQLSKRTFASSGFELGLQARLKVGNRFKIYAGLAFNQKQTQFTYNLAITEADYFTYIENGEKVPLENIHDDGMNSCFLAKDVTAKYQLQTLSMAIGTSFEFLRIGKFSAAADLRLSGNLYSSLKLKEMLVLDIKEPKSEIFSYLQPGAGLSLNFRVNQRLSLGLAPFFSKQFYLKQSFSRKLVELVIPLTVSFDL